MNITNAKNRLLQEIKINKPGKRKIIIYPTNISNIYKVYHPGINSEGNITKDESFLMDFYLDFGEQEDYNNYVQLLKNNNIKFISFEGNNYNNIIIKISLNDVEFKEK
jgi:hypothetical protein